ncbi:LexA family protein [Azospirillum canadense]|uniref:LexA family protein n=1 Tax=Azospirillum canadense TaxID=403962 RepID=UPI002225B711|nr:hypothetical protein [Azospirillum canadense]MCW2242782.1 SOS-response transcriptional repressor LexA [Azospirillum canadense]
MSTCTCPTCGQPMTAERCSTPVGLTPQQSKLLTFITEYQARNTGVTPSVRDMLRPMGLASTSGIARLLAGLEERGAIRRLNKRARAIEVLRRPVP